jgi:asparagine synthase (glutamine-hydrolysing)
VALKTFSVAFEEAGYDESPFARWVARRFETEHTEVLLTRRRFADWLPGALAGMDQPTFDGVNTYCVARAAKESGLTVALSGLGGDELFGGYPYFRTVPWVRRFLSLGRWLPVAVTAAAAGFLGARRVSGPAKLLPLLPQARDAESPGLLMLAAYQAAQMLLPPRLRLAVLAPELRAHPSGTWFGLPPAFVAELARELPPGEDAVGLVSRLVLRLFLGERCLRDTDALSMAVSLEVRAPFTDHGLLAAAFRVPAAVRCRGAPNKPFEWQLAKPYLGPDYPYRPKQGFVFPFERWLRDPELFGPVESVLRDREAVEAAGLDPAGVGTVLEGFRAGKVPWSRVWALFALCHWCRANGVGRC